MEQSMQSICRISPNRPCFRQRRDGIDGPRRTPAARAWAAMFAEKGRGIRGSVRLQCKSMKLEEIVAEASKLSEEERASLASQLLHGLETPVYSVSDKEVRRRMLEADADPSVLITFDELVAGLRHRGS